jgi:hypothetical protein
VRALLIFLALNLVVAALASAQDCEAPSEYALGTTRTEQGIQFSFAITDSEYVHEEFVDFYYVMQNIAPDSAWFEWSYWPYDEIRVFADSCLTPDQPGCVPVFIHPETFIWPSVWLDLAPGECDYPWSEYWRIPSTVPAGGYRAFMWMGEVSRWFGTGSVAELSLLHLDFEILSPSTGVKELPAINSTWGTIKGLYRDSR